MTPAQREWLKQQLPAYIEARQNRRLPIYWPTLYTLWFEDWPPHKPIEGNLTDSEREDEDAHMDVVDGSASDVDIVSEANVTTPEATAILGKPNAGANKGHKKKRLSQIPSRW